MQRGGWIKEYARVHASSLSTVIADPSTRAKEDLQIHGRRDLGYDVWQDMHVADAFDQPVQSTALTPCLLAHVAEYRLLHGVCHIALASCTKGTYMCRDGTAPAH